MRCIILVAFLLLFSSLCLAQSFKVPDRKNLSADSLRYYIDNYADKIPDTSMVNFCVSLSTKLLYVDGKQSYNYIEKGLQLAKKINFEKGYYRCNNNLALHYFNYGMLNKAFDILSKNKDYYTKTNDLKSLALTYENIGIIYGSQDKMQKAIECFQEAETYYLKSYKPRELVELYQNMGNAYMILKDEQKSIFYLSKALEYIDSKSSDSIFLLATIGRAYHDFDKLDLALNYYNKAFEKNKLTNSLFYNMVLNKYFGDLYIKKKQYSLAIEYLNKATKDAKNSKSLTNLVDIHTSLSEVYSAISDYKNAFSVNKNLLKLKDSLNKINNASAVEKIEVEFDLKEQESKVASLEQQKKIDQATIKKNKLILLLISSILLLVVLFALAAYLYLKKLYKNKLKIAQLESSLKGQFIERKRLAKELHDGIGSSIAAVKLKVVNTFNSYQIKENETLKSLDRVYNEVRVISHNLIPPDFSKKDFKEVLENLVKNYENSVEIEFILTDPNNTINFLSETEKQSIYRILQEAFNNSFKHAKCSYIALTITAFDNSISFIFEDNGVGFDEAKAKNGIGLQNMKERAKDININLEIDATINQGTIISFKIYKENKLRRAV